MGNEKVITDNNFQSEVLNSNLPFLLDFWAEWCGPCRMLSPIVDRLATLNQGKINVGKINVDENPSTAQRYGIQGIPTLLFFKKGDLVEQLVGFQSEESIQRAINEVILA